MDEDDQDESKEWSGVLPTDAILKGEYGQVRPTSPDGDVFVDGHSKYVMEFDKMKKVHVHDWKWVDVAVFDYNEETERFYVRTIYTPIVHAWVDKIYLCFDGEDPNTHGKRIRDAVVRRIESENIMRFNLYVDCLPVESIPSIDPTVLDAILSKTLSTPRLYYTEDSLEKVKKEIDLEYKRTLAKAKFIRIIEKHHHLYKPWVQIPEEDRNFCYMSPPDSTPDWKRLEEICSDIPTQVFCYKKLRVIRNTVRFGEKEPRDALNKVHEICLRVRKKYLILTDLEPMSIDEWEQRQIENIIEVD
jgi:dynein heavy chain